ncbi:helix-turn-helix transcriptional regulator [Mammaliicoccus fleurettii]|uniref:Helix-turn-helix transcriptional regulator n=1 Tax=Mammaliicoccus fleurettii TaxID=150056 RepID=A0ABS5MLJ6_9STAP|nr:helix-turn-helix transcriptional regulator [Mammaliicoccus fleurettii]MBL0846995.1 helix-turn-helix transcriptional regulator [Mammaliicoccus fleurettii]MBS3671719.1 helix-turn-helix transcriptional regulator [Mammaliicoccus fleurettii]MBS3696783.1 helix-turn-helix transcriptional regulator [Mammaliicoccus fleurettii]
MMVVIKDRYLKELMFLKGYNLSTLAAEVGISISYMSQIINGKRTPSAMLATKISKVFGVRVDELFTFKDKEKLT